MEKPMLGPTFEEMLDPTKIDPEIRARAIAARTAAPLDPINLYNISWRDLATGAIRCEVLPHELTGVDAEIVVLYGREFPSGSHKVGAAYSVLAEMMLSGEVDPRVHTVVWPSTGNYGIGGTWVGGRMGARSIVILPETMSRERFERIEAYGGTVARIPGVESNVRETWLKIQELRRNPNIRVLNQFEAMGNYRFHYYVTGNTIVDLAAELEARGIGRGRIAAFCSAMGSGGTIAAGDRLKQVWPEVKVVGLEPVQCPTLYNNGYGTHGIQGIGDGMITWIHNAMNMDAIMCVDDLECMKGLQLLSEEPGMAFLVRLGIPEERVRALSTLFGISGICNVLGAIKTARHYGFGRGDVIVTIATDAIDRYRSTMQALTEQCGPMDEAEAAVRLKAIFHGQKTDWIKDGTPEVRRQWHNLKYYTWVDMQGKSVHELNAQLDPEWWLAHQAKVEEIDRGIRAARG